MPAPSLISPQRLIPFMKGDPKGSRRTANKHPVGTCTSPGPFSKVRDFYTGAADRIRKNPIRSAFITLVIAAFLVRLHAAYNWPLDSDEGFYLANARYTVRHGWLPYRDYDVGNQAPLFYLLTAGCLRIFGMGVFQGRLLSVFASTITTALVYGIAGRIYDRRTGLLAAMVYGFSPFTLRYGVIAVTEPLQIMFVTGAVYLYMKGIEKADHRFFAVTGLLLVMAVLARRSAGYVLGTLLVALPVIYLVTPGLTSGPDPGTGRRPRIALRNVLSLYGGVTFPLVLGLFILKEVMGVDVYSHYDPSGIVVDELFRDFTGVLGTLSDVAFYLVFLALVFIGVHMGMLFKERVRLLYYLYAGTAGMFFIYIVLQNGRDSPGIPSSTLALLYALVVLFIPVSGMICRIMQRKSVSGTNGDDPSGGIDSSGTGDAPGRDIWRSFFREELMLLPAALLPLMLNRISLTNDFVISLMDVFIRMGLLLMVLAVLHRAVRYMNHSGSKRATARVVKTGTPPGESRDRLLAVGAALALTLALVSVLSTPRGGQHATGLLAVFGLVLVPPVIQLLARGTKTGHTGDATGIRFLDAGPHAGRVHGIAFPLVSVAMTPVLLFVPFLEFDSSRVVTAFAILGIFLVSLILLAAGWRPRAPRVGRNYGPWIVIAWFLSVFWFYHNYQFMPVYYSELMPPAAIMGAALMVPLVSRFRESGGTLLVLLIMVSGAVAVPAYGETPFFEERGLHVDTVHVRDVAAYVGEHTGGNEDILAWPVYAFEADRDVIFDIILMISYDKYDPWAANGYSDLGYPSISAIKEYMEEKALRMVVVDHLMRNYIFISYPNFGEYVRTNYTTVKTIGGTDIMLKDVYLE